MAWLEFHTLRDTPRRRKGAREIVDGLRDEGINARMVEGKVSRSGCKTVVVEVDSSDWGKVKDLLNE